MSNIGKDNDREKDVKEKERVRKGKENNRRLGFSEAINLTLRRSKLLKCIAYYYLLPI